MSMRKPLPTITWQNIGPPYYEYEYFQGYEHYPFLPTSENFDLVNAWWLIETSILVYAEEEFVRPCFQRVGLPEVKYFSDEGTDCFVANNDNSIIVAFRGTESRRRPGTKDFQNVIADVKADCNIILVESLHGNRVHKGFNDALDEVWEELLNYIKSIIRTIFKQNLNKSKDSTLLRLVFEDRHRYEVKQQQEKVDEKVGRWRDKFKKREKQEVRE